MDNYRGVHDRALRNGKKCQNNKKLLAHGHENNYKNKTTTSDHTLCFECMFITYTDEQQ